MSLTNILSIFSAGNDAGFENISASSAIQFANDEDVVFVDVRSKAEVQAYGTIKNAIIAPLNELNIHAKTDGSGLLPSVDEGKKIILVCASGARSGVAAQQLASIGYDVANLSGGIGAWARAGGAISR